MTTKSKQIPVASENTVQMPQVNDEVRVLPEPMALEKKMPTSEKPENCITFKNETIEIRPTKMKYFRNRTASVYKILKMIPLTEFLAYDKGVFDAERDSDQILFDFLVAVFDNSKIVTRYYDDMTADDIERILEIFCRLNHISEKEEANSKNKQAQLSS